MYITGGCRYRRDGKKIISRTGMVAYHVLVVDFIWEYSRPDDQADIGLIFAAYLLAIIFLF